MIVPGEQTVADGVAVIAGAVGVVMPMVIFKATVSALLFSSSSGTVPAASATIKDRKV